MADWFEIKDGDPLPTTPSYLVVGEIRMHNGALHRAARYFHDLSKVKLAITNSFAWNGTLNRDVRVYEWDGTGWQEIYFLAKGSNKKDHVLWKGVAPKHKQTISEVDVDEAVASILGIQQSEED